MVWLRNYFQNPKRHHVARLVILALVSLGSFAALITPFSVRPSTYPLREGEVASQDIQAPRTLVFESKIQTDQARETAANAVLSVYLPADPGITRSQIEKMRGVLNFISTIRSDSFATDEQKQADLRSIEEITLSPDVISSLIGISNSRWEVIQQESLSVLEQVMRATIRDTNLQDARRNIPSLISLSLPQEQADIVSALVTPFVSPNSLYSQEQTESARATARTAVEPVMRTYSAGEIIVRRGQVISPLAWEALNQFNLIQPEDNSKNIIAAAILVVIMSVFSLMYFRIRPGGLMGSLRSLAMISLVFILFLVSARLLIPNRVVLPYLFPLAAFGLTISCVFSLELGLVFSLLIGILTAYNLSNSLDLTLFYILTGMFGVLSLFKGQRISNFLISGLVIGISGSAVLLAFRLPGTIDLLGTATLVGASFFNGIASASLTLILQYLFSQILGLTTPIQLLELQRPDHPLSKFILRNAPGTYQHSLQVANLAEQAAEAIGADALLTRVGAIYHDAGKAANPSYFVENQVVGANPHDNLDPYESAGIILHHVTDGVVLGRKYHLPRRLLDFMLEHHGTLITRYQYARAVQAENSNESAVDKEKFRYPGPRPQSRETALLMLADNCEARVRANPPRDEQALRETIQQAFDYVQQQHQLDDTRLTMRDLHLAYESFFHTLRNMYHPRIPYPEIQKNQEVPTTPIQPDTAKENQ